jgi:3-hydroxybutyryl-CoA dehydrogenase
MNKKKETGTVVIAGTGVMGASIAQVFALHGHRVIVYGRSESSLQRGRNLVKINQEAQMSEEKLSVSGSKNLLANITWSTDLQCFQEAALVIETIVENMQEKKTFWQKISPIVTEECILTSNTSGLSITEMSSAVEKPGRFAGMHWVNPPHIVPLVEIISGEKTDEATADAIAAIAKSVGKVPVRVQKDAKGFILNRIQFAVLREAMHIVESGIAQKEDVDNVLKYGLGMRYACLGPFEIADIGGLDTFYNVASYLFADLSDRKDVSNLLADPCKRGEFGVKSEKGFYDYAQGKASQVIEKRDKDFLRIADVLYREL